MSLRRPDPGLIPEIAIAAVVGIVAKTTVLPTLNLWMFMAIMVGWIMIKVEVTDNDKVEDKQ